MAIVGFEGTLICRGEGVKHKVMHVCIYTTIKIIRGVQ